MRVAGARALSRRAGRARLDGAGHVDWFQRRGASRRDGCLVLRLRDGRHEAQPRLQRMAIGKLPKPLRRGAEARGRVAMIGLLSPETRYELEFHFSGWIPGFPARGRPLLPEVRKLRGARLVCVYGAGEKDSLCPELDTAWAEVRVFPGGHHLGRDYGALADALFPPSASP